MRISCGLLKEPTEKIKLEKSSPSCLGRGDLQILEEKLKAGDQVDFQLYEISKDYYNYMFKLTLATGIDGNPFPKIPSAVRGNIINQTNSNNYAFG